MLRVLLCVAIFFTAALAHASEDGSPSVEISFGSSLLFVEQPLQLPDDCVESDHYLPVPSVLILGEYFLGPRFTLGSFLNIPTSSRRRLVDGEIIDEPTSTVVALGVTHRPVEVPILDDEAAFGLQYGILAGRQLTPSREHEVFPMVFTRPSISTPEGFSMYLGVAYAFRNETLAVLYGVGQRF
jgi:hypothetical protein